MSDEFLETFWDQLLSGDAELTRTAFAQIDQVSQKAVLEHLQIMVSEEGWLPQQVASAQAALDALQGEQPWS